MPWVNVSLSVPVSALVPTVLDGFWGPLGGRKAAILFSSISLITETERPGDGERGPRVSKALLVGNLLRFRVAGWMGDNK